MKGKTFKNSTLKCVILCSMFCFAGYVNAGAQLGVAGSNVESFLLKRNMKFDSLKKSELENLDILKNYSALIYAKGKPSLKEIVAIRQYLKGGGVLYWNLPWKEDIAGAIDATGGRSPGVCLRVKAEKNHPITNGLDLGEWIPIGQPFNFLLKNYACTHGILPQCDDCETLLTVEVAKIEETKGENGNSIYAPAAKKDVYPWLVVYKYGKGCVVTGMSGMFRYEMNVEGRKKTVVPIDKLLMNLVSFLRERKTEPQDLKIVSAKLFMEMIDCNKGLSKPIFINGIKVGEVPNIYRGWSESTPVEIPPGALRAIASKNSIQIQNPDKDPFKLRNLYLEVTDKDGNIIRSDICSDILCSFRRGWVCEGRRAEFNGAPLPVFTLTLPSDKLGRIPQPEFNYSTPSVSSVSNAPRKWLGLENALDGQARRTSCWVTTSDLIDCSKEELAQKLDSFNANELATFASNNKYNKLETKEQLDKIEWLRDKGYKIRISFGKLKPNNNLLPGTEGYKAFLEKIRFWAPKVDVIGCDEWFLSPAMAATQGGTVSYFSSGLIKAFCKYANISQEDALWVFKGRNKFSDDPRAIKAWEFCDKVQNDIMREFARVAKEANPEVKTWISYITCNWNKYVTSIDSAVKDFDEILDCQTYWYGRYSNDPLNAAKNTNAIGLGKIYQYEYPKKTVWMGFGPGYAGGNPRKTEKTKHWNYVSHYKNTPEEIVPYLATLYASSDGVFIFTALNGNAPGNGCDSDFADIFRLVSSLVPRIKDYVKSDVAYYYDPQATWDAVRKGNAWFFKREGNRVSIGYLQQFCDVDVTKDTKKYENVAVSGILLPESLDYEKQKLYFMYSPEYSRTGQKVSSSKLETLGLNGFGRIPTAYYSLKGDVQADRTLGIYTKAIERSEKVLRSLETTQNGKSINYVVGSQNKRGNIRVNSFFPPYTRQNVMRRILREDLEYFKWAKRDCPQVNGVKNIVAVAFKEPRTAVIDFGEDVSYDKVKIVVFNGKDGVTRNEILSYERGMKIELPALNVLVAKGEDSGFWDFFLNIF